MLRNGGGDRFARGEEAPGAGLKLIAYENGAVGRAGALLDQTVATERVQKIAAVRVEDPSFMESSEYTVANQNGTFDLMIFDQCSPKALPSANTLFIGSLPPDANWTGVVDAPR